MDIKNVLRQLCDTVGVSGEEKNASEKAADLLRIYTDDVAIDAFGNVVGYLRSADANAKTLMLDAHIDSVGMIVTYIENNGFLRVGACGSPDLRTLMAQSVTVYGKRSVPGVVATLPPHIRKNSEVPEIGDISIDIGLSREEAEEVVSLGDRVVVNSEFRELNGDMISSAAVDDRSGVCAVLYALELLKGKRLHYHLAVCFSAQEETGERGVKQAAFRIAPDEAIAVDVSFGNTPDGNAHDTAEIGSGAMIGFSACLDKGMSNRLRDIAAREKIPFTCEVMPSSTGTNADAIAVSGKGVKCCTVSFPIRYMHTAVECVKISDIKAASELICAYVIGGETDD